jgi:hypothetical protein
MPLAFPDWQHEFNYQTMNRAFAAALEVAHLDADRTDRLKKLQLHYNTLVPQPPIYTWAGGLIETGAVRPYGDVYQPTNRGLHVDFDTPAEQTIRAHPFRWTADQTGMLKFSGSSDMNQACAYIKDKFEEHAAHGNHLGQSPQDLGGDHMAKVIVYVALAIARQQPDHYVPVFGTRPQINTVYTVNTSTDSKSEDTPLNEIKTTIRLIYTIVDHATHYTASCTFDETTVDVKTVDTLDIDEFYFGGQRKHDTLMDELAANSAVTRVMGVAPCTADHPVGPVNVRITLEYKGDAVHFKGGRSRRVLPATMNDWPLRAAIVESDTTQSVVAFADNTVYTWTKEHGFAIHDTANLSHVIHTMISSSGPGTAGWTQACYRNTRDASKETFHPKSVHDLFRFFLEGNQHTLLDQRVLLREKKPVYTPVVVTPVVLSYNQPAPDGSNDFYALSSVWKPAMDATSLESVLRAFQPLFAVMGTRNYHVVYTTTKNNGTVDTEFKKLPSWLQEVARKGVSVTTPTSLIPSKRVTRSKGIVSKYPGYFEAFFTDVPGEFKLKHDASEVVPTAVKDKVTEGKEAVINVLDEAVMIGPGANLWVIKDNQLMTTEELKNGWLTDIYASTEQERRVMHDAYIKSTQRNGSDDSQDGFQDEFKAAWHEALEALDTTADGRHIPLIE